MTLSENEQHADDCGSDPRLRIGMVMISGNRLEQLSGLNPAAAFVTLPETDLTVRAEYTLK
jgi:hypothetical protein